MPCPSFSNCNVFLTVYRRLLLHAPWAWSRRTSCRHRITETTRSGCSVHTIFRIAEIQYLESRRDTHHRLRFRPCRKSRVHARTSVSTGGSESGPSLPFHPCRIQGIHRRRSTGRRATPSHGKTASRVETIAGRSDLGTLNPTSFSLKRMPSHPFFLPLPDVV